jgi:formylglycine-generating enzyme required for sulfatase activity
VELGKRTDALRPVRSVLTRPLTEIYRDTRRSESERSFSISLLADFAGDRPELLVDLLLDTDEQQFALLWPALRKQTENTVPLLRRELQLPLPRPDQVQAHNYRARRHAWAAVGLLLCNEQDASVWSLLRHSDDPGRRTYFMHALGRLGADPALIVAQLEHETDVSARRALILSLGEFSQEQLAALSPMTNQQAVDPLVRWYRDDTDPGIHSAIDWLLRATPIDGKRKPDWKQAERLAPIDHELATGEPVGFRRWYLTSTEGHTLAIVPRPERPFCMGSSTYQSSQLAGEDEAHPTTIPRSFAIATKEVTVAQFQRFLDDRAFHQKTVSAGSKSLPPASVHKFDRTLCPDDDGPALRLSWFEAARYCNWLSEQEGIPESEWCYPKEICEGMELPKDYLHRRGYRLPTEAEWEFACRAGALTTRFYGSDPAFLREFAWFAETANRHAMPVGLLKPNDLGLFDIYGNAMEWCQDDGSKSSSANASGGPTVDSEDDELRVTLDRTRGLRGGSFWYLEPSVRSAYCDHQRPVGQVIAVGLRLARTMP